MEIITYVVDGELSHQDSMGNKEALSAGNVQYLSAGTGITHSEMNDSDKKSRFLQIWIVPPQNDTKPIYGSLKYEKNQSVNKLLNIVSSQSGEAQIKIHQDVNIFVSRLDANQSISVDIKENRQIYFVQIEGTSTINKVELNHADAMEITKESKIDINAISDSHFLFIEMKEN